MKKKLNLKSIRDQIDKIDDKILPLVIKRSKLVNLALEAKTKKSQIIDEKRINKILTKIENKSKIAKANHNLIKTIWKSMIWNFIDFEKKEFKKRK